MTDYQLLRELRMNKFNLSQSEFGHNLGIGQNKLSKLETGRTKIPTEIMIKLMMVYKINPFYLYGLSQNSTIEEELLTKLVSSTNNKNSTMLNINVTDNIHTVVQGNTINKNDNNIEWEGSENNTLLHQLIIAKDKVIESKNETIEILQNSVKNLNELISVITKKNT